MLGWQKYLKFIKELKIYCMPYSSAVTVNLMAWR